MSESLKLCSGSTVIKKLVKIGWIVDRQVGSHVMLVKGDYIYTISVPQHKELGIGILKKIVNQAGLSNEEFNIL